MKNGPEDRFVPDSSERLASREVENPSRMQAAPPLIQRLAEFVIFLHARRNIQRQRA